MCKELYGNCDIEPVVNFDTHQLSVPVHSLSSKNVSVLLEYKLIRTASTASIYESMSLKFLQTFWAYVTATSKNENYSKILALIMQ